VPTPQERPRAILLALESSLAESRKALLNLDLAAIELASGEQRRLIRELESHPPSAAFPSFSPAELRQSAHRILESVRLHAALLVRLRSKLRVLANARSGSAAAYGPPSPPNDTPSSAPATNGRGIQP
jgi:hypothetical protein